MQKPSPYQIAAFTQAARDRSFSKAAAALGVTQSSITQHVAKLEKLMGAQLFIRRRDGLELTRAARELFEISDRLRTLEQLIEEKIADYGTLSTGHLRIIANAPRPAMPLIAEHMRRHPQVKIEFSLFNWTLAMQKLREREVDVAIVTEPGSEPGLYARELEQTRYAAYLHRDHPLAAQESVSLQQLSREVVILPEDGSFTQRVVNAKIRRHGVEMPRVIKTTTFPVVKEAALHGVGIGILLTDSLFPSSNLAVIPIDEMPEIYRTHLVTPEEKRELRLVKSFIDIAFEA